MRVGTLFLLLLCSLASDAQQQKVTDPEWVCTFSLKGESPLLDPTVHIHVLVTGKSEGDAAIKASNYLQAALRDEKRLCYLEAGLKK